MLFDGSLGNYTNQFAEICKNVSDLLLPKAAQARFLPPPRRFLIVSALTPLLCSFHSLSPLSLPPLALIRTLQPHSLPLR